MIKRNFNGQSLVEIALVLSLVAIACIAVLGQYRVPLCRVFASVFGISIDAMNSTFGKSAGHPQYIGAYDFDGNGTVDAVDLSIFGNKSPKINCETGEITG